MKNDSRTPTRTILVLLLWTLGCGVAAADSTEPEYLLEFRAYRDALERGDAVAAAKHSYNAWQDSDNALGNHRLTAVLAYYHGLLVIFSDKPSARLALNRVAELQELAPDDVDVFELAVYRTYLDFAGDPGKRRTAAALRDALRDSMATGVPGSPVLAEIWLELGAADLAAGRHGRAIECADSAERMLHDSEDYRSLATAKLIRGAAILVEDAIDLSAGLAAHKEFESARSLFPRQMGIDSFDPVLAQVIAWDAAAGAARVSMGGGDYPPHEHDNANNHHSDTSVFDRGVYPDDCGAVEWAVRTPPEYPPGALRKNFIGAVLVGFKIADDLTVEDARVLAEVPSERFSGAVLTAVQSWRARPLVNENAACRENQILRATFAIEY